MNDEKKMIKLERERLLRDKDDRMFELESIRAELKEDKELIRFERQRLLDLRQDFLQEVDVRVQKRIEDWENQTLHSARNYQILDH